jgi:hypothetical protein
MQTMDTTPPPADDQETSEHETAKRVSTSSNDSSSHPKKYAKSHVKFLTKTTTPNSTSESPVSILQTEYDVQTTTPEISTTWLEKKKSLPLALHEKLTTSNF